MKSSIYRNKTKLQNEFIENLFSSKNHQWIQRKCFIIFIVLNMKFFSWKSDIVGTSTMVIIRYMVADKQSIKIENNKIIVNLNKKKKKMKNYLNRQIII